MLTIILLTAGGARFAVAVILIPTRSSTFFRYYVTMSHIYLCIKQADIWSGANHRGGRLANGVLPMAECSVRLYERASSIHGVVVRGCC